MIGYIVYFILGILVYYVYHLLDLNVTNEQPIPIDNKIKYRNIKYYTNGIEIPLSFRKEYRIVFNSYSDEIVTKSQIESNYIDLIGSDTELVRTVLNQTTKIRTEFVYDSEVFYLAKEYLINENEYLTNLN